MVKLNLLQPIEVLLVAGSFGGLVCLSTAQVPLNGVKIEAASSVYACPMHEQIRSAFEGHCPRCKMKLVRTRLAYSCPAHPGLESPAPGACPRCRAALLPVANIPKYKLELVTAPATVRAGEEVELQFNILQPDGKARIKDVYIVHEKPFHLFIISRDLAHYQHIHPQPQADGSFTVRTTLPRESDYEIIADLFPVGGTPQLIRRRLTTAGADGGSNAAPAPLTVDRVLSKSLDRTRFALDFDSKPVAGSPVVLRYKLTDAASGAPVRDLSPYLGAWGHSVILSEDTRDFVHSHPKVSVASSTAQAGVFSDRAIEFETVFPRPGRYRIWSQFQRADVLSTVSFVIEVPRSEPIAIWNSARWEALSRDVGTALDGDVRAVAATGSDLYVGGDFTAGGDVRLNGVGKWDGKRWSALGGGVNGTVWAIATIGTDVYIAGDFTRAGTTAAHGVAKWNGRRWSALGSGIRRCDEPQCTPTAYALAASSGRLYVGGRFGYAGNVQANGIAKWDGVRWSGLGEGFRSGSYDGIVRALAVTDADVLYAGGSFKSAGEVQANNIARWDGRKWSALGEGLAGGLEQVLAIATRRGKEVVAGGAFTRAGTTNVSNAAVWNGTNWLSTDIQTSSPVRTIVVKGAYTYFGGSSFTLPSGAVAHGLARWNSMWTSLDTGLANGDYASAVMGMTTLKGKLIAAGEAFSLPASNGPASSPERSK